MVSKMKSDKKGTGNGRIIGKRGQVQYLLESAFRIGFLMIAILVFFLLINMYVANKIDTQTLKYHVVVNKLIYSDIFMQQKNGVTYTGIVDIEKFNDERIANAIDYSNKRFASAKLTIIKNKDPDEIDNLVNEKTPVATAYLNKAQYDILTVTGGEQGQGGATYYFREFPISYFNLKDDKYYYGMLKIEVMVPNS